MLSGIRKNLSLRLKGQKQLHEQPERVLATDDEQQQEQSDHDSKTFVLDRPEDDGSGLDRSLDTRIKNHVENGHPPEDESSSNQEHEKDVIVLKEVDQETHTQKEEEKHAPVKVPTVSASAGWILPVRLEKDVDAKRMARWGKTLQELVPSRLLSSMQKRSSHSKSPFHVRVEQATVAKQELLHNKTQRLSGSYIKKRHIASATADKHEVLKRLGEERLLDRLQQADQKRDAVLREKQERARQLQISHHRPTPCPDDVSALRAKVYDKSDAADQRRKQILKDVQDYASNAVDSAKKTARSMRELNEKASQLDREISIARVDAADLRRSAHVEANRRSAARQLQYVSAVLHTNDYIKKQTGELLRSKMDAAGFRRALHLEELSGKARQDSLNAAFKAYSTQRNYDAKWLSIVIASNARHTSAKIKRDALLHERLVKLRESENRRLNVLSIHKYYTANAEAMSQFLEAKQRAAKIRRQSFLQQRAKAWKTRQEVLERRKAAAQVAATREAKQRVQEKLTAAMLRYAAKVEAKRRAAARANWRTRSRVEEYQRNSAERKQVLVLQSDAKQELARMQREERMVPVFSYRNREQADIVKERLRIRHGIAADTIEHKLGAAEVRRLDSLQLKLKQSYVKALKAQVVQQQRISAESAKKLYDDMTSQHRLTLADQRYADQLTTKKNAGAKVSEKVQRVRDGSGQKAAQAGNDVFERLEKAKERKQQALEDKLRHSKKVSWRVGMRALIRDGQQDDKKREIERALRAAETRREELLSLARASRELRQGRVEQNKASLSRAQDSIQTKSLVKKLRASVRKVSLMDQKIQNAKFIDDKLAMAKLTQKAEASATSAVKSALIETLTRSAEFRRRESLEQVQMHAAVKSWHARAVADAQRELNTVKAEAQRERSKLKLLQSSKRRDDILDMKRQHESLSKLQPFAGLEVVGKRMEVNHLQVA